MNEKKVSVIMLVTSICLLTGCLSETLTKPDATTTETLTAEKSPIGSEASVVATTEAGASPSATPATVLSSDSIPTKPPVTPDGSDNTTSTESLNLEEDTSDLYLPEIPRITSLELKSKIDDGANIVIVDSRSETAYNISHIANAISIPLSNMYRPYPELEGFDEIITYCT